MQVRLMYTVPVSVLVDLDTGEVDRVVVEDEAVEMVTPIEAYNHDEDDSTISDATTMLLAGGIAETKPWPGWEFGW